MQKGMLLLQLLQCCSSKQDILHYSQKCCKVAALNHRETSYERSGKNQLG